MDQANKDILNNLVSVLQLRKLLFDISEKRPDICVRFRLMGELWMPGFSHVSAVTDKGVVLTIENSNRLLLVPNLNNVMQFDLDHNFQEYKAHNHYDVYVDRD